MAAVAHGWHKPGGGGPPVSVAREFNSADKGTGIMKKFDAGGPTTEDDRGPGMTLGFGGAPPPTTRWGGMGAGTLPAGPKAPTSSARGMFARGGAVIGTYSPFMKTPDEFRERDHAGGGTDEVFGKGPSKGDEDQARGKANPVGKSKQIPRP